MHTETLGMSLAAFLKETKFRTNEPVMFCPHAVSRLKVGMTPGIFSGARSPDPLVYTFDPPVEFYRGIDRKRSWTLPVVAVALLAPGLSCEVRFAVTCVDCCAEARINDDDGIFQPGLWTGERFAFPESE